MPSLLCSLASCHFLLVLLSGSPAPPCTRSWCPGLLSALGLFSFPSVLERDAFELSPAEPFHAPQSHGLLPALHSSPGLPGPWSRCVQDESPQPPSGDPGVTPIAPSVVCPLSTLTPLTVTPSSQTRLMAGCHPVSVSGGVCLPPGFTLTACPPHGGQYRPSKLCSLRNHPPDLGSLCPTGVPSGSGWAPSHLTSPRGLCLQPSAGCGPLCLACSDGLWAALPGGKCSLPSALYALSFPGPWSRRSGGHCLSGEGVGEAREGVPIVFAEGSTPRDWGHPACRQACLHCLRLPVGAFGGHFQSCLICSWLLSRMMADSSLPCGRCPGCLACGLGASLGARGWLFCSPSSPQSLARTGILPLELGPVLPFRSPLGSSVPVCVLQLSPSCP